MDPSSDIASLVDLYIIDYNTNFVCRKCDKNFLTTARWELHNFHYHMNLKYMCTHCNFRYLDINDFVNHMKSEHSIDYHICTICGNLYYHEKAFKDHLFQYHQAYQYPGMYFCYKCTPCKIYFYDQLITHDSQKHCADIITNSICYVCGIKLDNCYDLPVHKASHYTEKLRKCLEPSCREKIFDTLIELKKHIIENHPGRFLCTRCFSGLTFITEADLQIHVEEYHKDQFELL